MFILQLMKMPNNETGKDDNMNGVEYCKSTIILVSPLMEIRRYMLLVTTNTMFISITTMTMVVARTDNGVYIGVGES